jgi:hypothetical protein
LSSRMWWVGEAFKDLRYCLAAKLPQAWAAYPLSWNRKRSMAAAFGEFLFEFFGAIRSHLFIAVCVVFLLKALFLCQWTLYCIPLTNDTAAWPQINFVHTSYSLCLFVVDLLIFWGLHQSAQLYLS